MFLAIDLLTAGLPKYFVKQSILHVQAIIGAPLIELHRAGRYVLGILVFGKGGNQSVAVAHAAHTIRR